MIVAKLRLAMVAMGQRETVVGELCRELWVPSHTLYRHVARMGVCGRRRDSF
jgi:hypothetical protein